MATKTVPATVSDSKTSEVDKMKSSLIVKVSNQVSTPTNLNRNLVSLPSSTVAIATNNTTNKSQLSVLGKMPTILKTGQITKSPARRPLTLTKYLDTLPEINDCIHNDGIDDSGMEKLPDKILLVHSELPLPLAVSIDKEDQNYLFRYCFIILN